MKGKEWFLIISLALILVYGMVYFLLPQFQTAINNFNNSLENFARANGYWGAFVVSFVGAASLFITIPYIAFVFLLSTLGLNIWPLALLAGFGAALGEITAYLAGYIGGKFTARYHGEKYEKIKSWILRHPRLTPVIIFIFGATPLPDDLIFIPMGLARYNFFKAFVPGFLGKTVLVLATIYLGKTSLGGLGLQSSSFWSEIITLCLTVVIIYAALKINWEKLIIKNNV